MCLHCVDRITPVQAIAISLLLRRSLHSALVAVTLLVKLRNLFLYGACLSTPAVRPIRPFVALRRWLFISPPAPH